MPFYGANFVPALEHAHAVRFLLAGSRFYPAVRYRVNRRAPER